MNKLYDKNTFENYLFLLTDSVGIFQHSKYGIPDRNHGYTTDDNARALILAVMLYEKFSKKKYLKLIYTYLSFIHHSINKNGMFMNFMNYQRNFLEETGSEDCFGRCIWALSHTISCVNIPNNIKNTCLWILKQADKNIASINSPRAKAYIIVGLSLIKDLKNNHKHIEDLSLSLAEQYNSFKKPDWHWFENSMTYGNSFFPWALFKAYKVTKNELFLNIAKESMNFLESIVIKENYFQPLGCDGWLVKGSSPAEFDQQPLEACEMLHTYLEYYDITKNEDYINKAITCYNWYNGQNSKKLCLIDNQTGACYDGICKNGLNLNQGSESIVSFGMSFMKILNLNNN